MGRYTIFFSSHLHWLYAHRSHYNHVYQILFQTVWNDFFHQNDILFYFILYFRFNHRLSKVAIYGLLYTFLLETLWRSQAIMMNWRPTSLVHLSIIIKKWKKIMITMYTSSILIFKPMMQNWFTKTFIVHQWWKTFVEKQFVSNGQIAFTYLLLT